MKISMKRFFKKKEIGEMNEEMNGIKVWRVLYVGSRVCENSV